MVNKVLILGGDKVGKKHLFSLAFDSPVEYTSTNSIFNSIVKKLLTTKYYEAELDLYFLNPKNISNVEDHTFWSDFQAIILIHDINRPETFNSIMKICETLGSLGHTYDVSLCIANSLTGNISPDDHMPIQHINDWCLDNGYEYVFMPNSKHVVQQEVISSPEDEIMEKYKDKHGHARILEALECNMWPEMSRKNTEKKEVSVEEIQTNQDSNTNTNNNENISNNSDITNQNNNNNNSDKKKKKKKKKKATNTNAEDEDPFKDFEQLLDKVRSVRMNGSKLSDQERREQAAKVAMQLFAMVASEGGSGSEDEGI